MRETHDPDDDAIDLHTALDEAIEACAPFHEALCNEISDVAATVAELSEAIREAACIIAAAILLHGPDGYEAYQRRVALWRQLVKRHPDIFRDPEEG